MFLILSLGSNLGDRFNNLKVAKKELQKHFKLKGQSRIYQSQASDYENQPDFFNQLLEFELPSILPSKLIGEILSIEKKLGRKRVIDKGPRIIDIDILFYHTYIINTKRLSVPHPRLFQRNFILRPLLELPSYKILSRHFSFPTKEEMNKMDKVFLVF